MRRFHPRLVLSTFLLLAAVAVVSFFLVRILTDDSSHDVARGQANASPAPNPLELILAEDAKKPRFVGEIQGIYISPDEQTVPEQHQVPPCQAKRHVPVSWDQAGQFALNVQLPPKFIFKPDDMNTGVIACEGAEVYTARWAYELPQPQFVDYPARLFIARGRSSWIYADASADRVKTVDLGGRLAVVVEPVRPEGAGSLGQDGTQASVSFPETFGMTSVTSTGVPLSDLLEVAKIVGSATKQ